MNNSPWYAEEELVLALGEPPSLSAGLRGRVLAAASAARGQRATRRKKAGGGAMLLLAAAAFLNHWPQGAPAPRAVAPLGPRHVAEESFGYARQAGAAGVVQQLMVFTSPNDWDLVEAELRLRALHSQVLRSNFYGAL